MTRQRGWRRIVEKWDAGVHVSEPNQTRVDVPKKAGDGHDEVGEYSVLLELLSDAIMYVSPTFTAEIAPKRVTTTLAGQTDFVAFSALDLSILGWPLLDTIPLHA